MKYLYNIYKNCSNEEFDNVKGRLSILGKKILKEYSGQLVQHKRAEDSDTLTLNFDIVHTIGVYRVYKTIFFGLEDKKAKITFEAAFIKAIDVERKRFYKKVIIGSDIELSQLEDTYKSYLSKAFHFDNSWSDTDIIDSGELTMLPF